MWHQLMDVQRPRGKLNFQLKFACPFPTYNTHMLVRVVARPVDLFLAVRLIIHGVTCSAMTGMLTALGPRLQRLTMHVRKGAREHNTMSGLAPAVLRHCPLLAHLALENIGPSTLAEVGLHASCCVTIAVATLTNNVQIAKAKAAVRQVCVPDPVCILVAGANWCAADSLQPVALVLPCRGTSPHHAHSRPESDTVRALLRARPGLRQLLRSVSCLCLGQWPCAQADRLLSRALGLRRLGMRFYSAASAADPILLLHMEGVIAYTVGELQTVQPSCAMLHNEGLMKHFTMHILVHEADTHHSHRACLCRSAVPFVSGSSQC